MLCYTITTIDQTAAWSATLSSYGGQWNEPDLVVNNAGDSVICILIYQLIENNTVTLRSVDHWVQT